MKGIIFLVLSTLLTVLQSNANNICSHCIKLDNIFTVNLDKKAFCTFPGAKVPGYVQFQAKTLTQCANLDAVLRKFAIRSVQIQSTHTTTEQSILLAPLSTAAAKIYINDIGDENLKNSSSTTRTILFDMLPNSTTGVVSGQNATTTTSAMTPLLSLPATTTETSLTTTLSSTDQTTTASTRNITTFIPTTFTKIPLAASPTSVFEETTSTTIFTGATSVSTGTTMSSVTKQIQEPLTTQKKNTEDRQHSTTETLVMATRSSAKIEEKESKLWRAMYKTFSLIRSLTTLNQTTEAMQNFNKMNPYSFFREPKKIMKLLTHNV